MKAKCLIWVCAIACMSLFVSCEEQEPIVRTSHPDVNISVDITWPENGSTESMVWRNPKYSEYRPRWIGSYLWRLKFPPEYDFYYADFVLCFELHSDNSEHVIEVDFYIPYFDLEYDKVYNIESHINSIPSDIVTAYLGDRGFRIWVPTILEGDIPTNANGCSYKYSYGPDDEVITNSWIKFCNRRIEEFDFPEYSRYIIADLEFGFEVYDKETGELIYKGENGKVQSIGFGDERDYLLM